MTKKEIYEFKLKTRNTSIFVIKMKHNDVKYDIQLLIRLFNV